jgi:hypothetical protein
MAMVPGEITGFHVLQRKTIPNPNAKTMEMPI